MFQGLLRVARRRPLDADERVPAMGGVGLRGAVVLRELRAVPLDEALARDPRAAVDADGARGAREQLVERHDGHPQGHHRRLFLQHSALHAGRPVQDGEAAAHRLHPPEQRTLRCTPQMARLLRARAYLEGIHAPSMRDYCFVYSISQSITQQYGFCTTVYNNLRSRSSI